MERVLVCGGRDYGDWHAMFAKLDTLHAERGIACIIEGGATGADSLAYEWALSRLIKSERFSADWKKHGRAAGPIRNKQMLDEGKPDLVVAFPGGKGTANMVKQARAAGIEVIEADAGPVNP